MSCSMSQAILEEWARSMPKISSYPQSRIICTQNSYFFKSLFAQWIFVLQLRLLQYCLNLFLFYAELVIFNSLKT
jgi:hypothetical protein